MNYEKKTFNWKPLSEYKGGRVLATNGLDLLIGEITSDGDCADGDGCLLCSITAFAYIDDIMPKPKESEDERIRKHLLKHFQNKTKQEWNGMPIKDIIAWLEKQSEEARNIALRTEYEKGRADVIAEVSEMPKEVDSQIWQIANNSAKTWEQSFAILNATQKAYDKGRKDALKEQKPTWSEEDEYIWDSIISDIQLRIESVEKEPTTEMYAHLLWRQFNWLKSLKDRVFPQNTWKPSDEQMEVLKWAKEEFLTSDFATTRELKGKPLESLYNDLKKLRHENTD